VINVPKADADPKCVMECDTSSVTAYISRIWLQFDLMTPCRWHACLLIARLIKSLPAPLPCCSYVSVQFSIGIYLKVCVLHCCAAVAVVTVEWLLTLAFSGLLLHLACQTSPFLLMLYIGVAKCTATPVYNLFLCTCPCLCFAAYSCTISPCVY
jgi:hypothetical protein